MKKKKEKSHKLIKEGKKFSYRDAKIGTKLSIEIGILILVGCTLLNLFSVSSSGKALEKVTEDQLNQICETNLQKVEMVKTGAKAISDPIIKTFEDLYSSGKDKGALTYISAANGKKLTKNQYIAENVILNAIWSGVKENDSVLGVGIMLEPYAFSKNMQDYSPYGYKNDLDSKKLDLTLYEDFSGKDYYTVPKKNIKMNFSEPYKDSVTGDNVISACYPILNGGEFIGIVIVDINSQVFSMLAAKNENFPSLHTNIANANGNILYDSAREDIIGKNISELMTGEDLEAYNINTKNNKTFSIVTGQGKDENYRYFTPVEAGAYTWWVQTAVLADEFNETKNTLKLVLNLLGIAVIVAAIIFTYLVLKRLLKPLNEMENAANSMAEGSLNVNIEYESRDELGRLADSMRNLMTMINTIIGDMVYGLAEVADGNFAATSKAEDAYIGDYEPLKTSLISIIMKLNETLGEIKVASAQVNSGSEQVSAAAQALSQGATEQASSVEELSATMTEISSQIKHNAEKSEEAKELSKLAGEEVILSNQKMQEMSTAMADITEKSNEIGKIIKTIDDIAFQTNILALNAAVEAARAGSAGKGFAVVADEVRNLAGKSAEAAKNTTILIESAIEAINNGDKLTAETAEFLNAVSENTEKVAILIDEISHASNEQAVGVSQINIGLEQISSVVQTNSATAEESAAASEELSGQANMMNNLIDKFRLMDDTK